MITKLTPDQVWQFKIRAKTACDQIEEKCLSKKYRHIIGCHHYFNRVIDAFDDGIDPYFKFVREEWKSRQNIYKEKTLEEKR